LHISLIITTFAVLKKKHKNLMPTKLRLQRHGKKANAFFHIVAADGRAPRDGKFIEKLGTYNPNSNPATIELDFDRALYWLESGAQPTDTCRAILSYKGVMYKYHLLKGVKKGALTPEQVEARLNKWIAEKEAKISSKKDNVSSTLTGAMKKRLDAETAAKETRAAKIAAKNAELAAAAEKKAEEPKVEEPKAEAQVDAPAADQTAAPEEQA
jgi:small subunit ribosomal protein S16